MHQNAHILKHAALFFAVLVFFSLRSWAGLNKSRTLNAGKHSFTIYGITGDYGGNIPLGGRNSSWPNNFTQRGGQQGDPWYSVAPVTGNERNNFGPNGTIIGVRNWQAPTDWTNATSDHPAGKFYNFYVSQYGLRYDDSDLNECFLKNNMMWKYLRQLPCAITLVPNPGEEAILPNITWGEGTGEGLDTDLPADQMVSSEYTHSVGISVRKRAFSFADRDHDDYAIIELTFINSGDTHANNPGIEIPEQTLSDVWIAFGQIVEPAERNGWGNDVGELDALVDYDESIKAFYAWDTDDPEAGLSLPDIYAGNDQWDPHPVTGEYLAPTFSGYSVIHADVSSKDHSNDLNKPTIVKIVPYGPETLPTTFSNQNTQEQVYNFISAGGLARPTTLAVTGQTRTHYVCFTSFGPYNFEPNDSVKIVFAKASNGISQSKCIELGYKFKNGMISQNDVDSQMWTGKDSLFTSFYLAKETYQNYIAYSAIPPLAPAYPESLYIEGEYGRVFLRWTEVPNVARYHVYRTIGNTANAFERISTETSPGTETQFIDENVTRGLQYFYFVTAIDAEGRESSAIATRTGRAAIPLAGAAKTVDDIIVAPNPWVITGGAAEFGGSLVDEPMMTIQSSTRIEEANTLIFFNLPERCTIKIYTVSGNLVKTLEHTAGNLERWSGMITDYHQFIVSGIYLYTVESDVGGTFGKFIVVR